MPITLSGSLELTGSIITTGTITMSGSIASASFATTSSNALTASSADTFIVRNNFTGSNALLTGTLTAQTLVVQTVTSSILYTSGSNRFGSQLTDRQTFTGSFYQTGSIASFSNCIILGGALSGTSATFSSTAYSNLILNGTNATGWGNNIAFQSQGTDFGYIGSIGSLLGNTTKDMTIWATSGSGFRVYTDGNNERMRIGSDGTKYFGNPVASRMQINSAGENLLQYTNNFYIYGLYNDSNNLAIESAFAGNIIFKAQAQTISSSPTTAIERMRITSGGNVEIKSAGELRVYRSDNARYGTFYTDNSAVNIATSVDPLQLSSPERIVFNTAGTERMRMDGGGDLYIATISNPVAASSGTGGWGYFATAYQAIATNSAPSLYLNRIGTDGAILVFRKNGSDVGSISTNSNSLPSDLNFKKNISNLELGLNLVTKLRAVSYNHKIDDHDAALSTGFIAQELEESLEELGVKENQFYILQHKPNEDEKQSQYWLDYTKMIPVLVKAIQEQQCTINTLKTCIGIA
jgi:hypothetical protein